MKSSYIVVIFGLLAVLAAVIVQQPNWRRGRQPEQAVTVLLAARDIPANKVIEFQDLVETECRLSELDENVARLEHLDEVIGRRAAPNIPKNCPIRRGWARAATHPATQPTTQPSW